MTQIKLVTAPVIKHDLYAVGASVTARIAELNLEMQVATEETVGALKKLRAELNKELAEFELQRKAIKEAVTTPYSELEVIYKSEVSDKYKAAGDLLKDKITFVEEEMKSNILKEVKSFFSELCLSESIDFLSFNQLGIEIKLSDSMKSYKDRITAFISKVIDELALIDTQNFKAEILVEYKKTLNAAKAIKEVSDRKEAEKLESDRIKMTETNNRKSRLLALTFVFHDLTKTFNYIHDETMMVSLSDVESLSRDEFNLKLTIFEAQIDAAKRKQAQIEAIHSDDNAIIAPVSNVSEPLQAPKIIQPEVKEELFVAVFEVNGTYAQLKGISEYLKSNSINYKNL